MPLITARVAVVTTSTSFSRDCFPDLTRSQTSSEVMTTASPRSMRDWISAYDLAMAAITGDTMDSAGLYF